jgi:hypothetical protein
VEAMTDEAKKLKRQHAWLLWVRDRRGLTDYEAEALQRIEATLVTPTPQVAALQEAHDADVTCALRWAGAWQ